MTAQQNDDKSREITTEEGAEIAGVSRKRFRSVLRSMTDDRAGKGSQWVLTVAQAEKVRDRIASGGNGNRPVVKLTGFKSDK